MKVTLTDRRKGDRDVSVVVENGGEPRRSVNERYTDTGRGGSPMKTIPPRHIRGGDVTPFVA